MNKIWEFAKSIYGISIGIISFLFNFIPESALTYGVFHVDWSNDVILCCNRLLLLAIVSIITALCLYLYRRFRTSETIRGTDYTIKVEYGNIMNVRNCKRVINFDECFTTKIGNRPQDINEGSICGQYLKAYPIADMSRLISQSHVSPADEPSNMNLKSDTSLEL